MEIGPDEELFAIQPQQEEAEQSPPRALVGARRRKADGREFAPMPRGEVVATREPQPLLRSRPL